MICRYHKSRRALINLRLVGFLFRPRFALPVAFIFESFALPFARAASCLLDARFPGPGICTYGTIVPTYSLSDTSSSLKNSLQHSAKYSLNSRMSLGLKSFARTANHVSPSFPRTYPPFIFFGANSFVMFYWTHKVTCPTKPLTFRRRSKSHRSRQTRSANSAYR